MLKDGRTKRDSLGWPGSYSRSDAVKGRGLRLDFLQILQTCKCIMSKCSVIGQRVMFHFNRLSQCFSKDASGQCVFFFKKCFLRLRLCGGRGGRALRLSAKCPRLPIWESPDDSGPCEAGKAEERYGETLGFQRPWFLWSLLEKPFFS